MIYDVDLDDGRTVTLEADNPPSEQDIYAALQSYQPPVPRPQLQPGDLAGPEARQIPDLTTTTSGITPSAPPDYSLLNEPLPIQPSGGIRFEGVNEPPESVGGMLSDIPRQIKELPKNLLTGAEYIAAAGMNIPAAMYREATGVTPKIGVIKRDESGQEILVPENAPLPFQPGKSVVEFPRTVLQPEGNTASRLVEGLLSPGMIATFPFAASKPVQIAFLSQTVPGAIDAAERLVAKGTPPEQRREAATDLLVNGLMSYGLARHLSGVDAFTGGTPRLEEANAKALAATIPPENVSIDTGGKVNQLRLEGMSLRDAMDLVSGKQSPEQVVEKNYEKIVSPAWNANVSQVQGGHGEAMISGYNLALERIRNILGEEPTKLAITKPGETYASPIRSDTGQILEAGKIPETSENVSGQNLQLAPPGQPEPVVPRVEQRPQAEVLPPVEPPKEVAPYEESTQSQLRPGEIPTGVDVPLPEEKAPIAPENFQPSAPPKPSEVSATRDWELLNENLIDNLDTFSPARSTGRKNYDLDDVADRFVEFAKQQPGHQPLLDLFKAFAKQDQASQSQLRKVRTALKDIEPAPETPPLVAETATQPVSQSIIPSLFIKEGKQLTQVSPEQASQIMGRIRSETGAGASKLGNVKLYDANGKQVAYVSYNGNVWLGTESNPVHGKDSLIHNANGIEWNESSKSWDVPKPPGWDALTKTQDDLDRIRSKNRDENDAALAATNPEFAKLILQRDRLIRATMGNAKALDVKSATPTPAEPKATIPETVQPIIETKEAKSGTLTKPQLIEELIGKKPPQSVANVESRVRWDADYKRYAKLSKPELAQRLEETRRIEREQSDITKLVRPIFEELKATAESAGKSWRSLLRQRADAEGVKFFSPPESTRGETAATLARAIAEKQYRNPPLETSTPISEGHGAASPETQGAVVTKVPPLTPTATPTPSLAPKSQRLIINDLAKGLNLPIRFGRLTTNKYAGYFKRIQNIIGTKRPNDVPVVSHEAGHKLDSVFSFSGDPTIAAELNVLGDPATPGSGSSWTPSKTKAYKMGEGVAEFVRYWLTDPTHAKTQAPNTFRAFENALNSNKDLGDTMRQAQSDIQTWKNAEPQARLRSHISIGENPNKTRYTTSQLTRDLVDDLHFVRLAVEHAERGAGSPLPPSRNPYLLARNLRGSYGMADTFIRSGIVDFNSKEVKLGTSLEDALKPVAGRLADFRDWMVAKRAQELHAQGRQTGLVDSDVNFTANKFNSDPIFQKAFDDVKQWQDSLLDYAVDSGLIERGSPATATEPATGSFAIREMNQDYVPFHRVFEVGAAEPASQQAMGIGMGLNVGKPGSLKRLKGSQRDIVDPLETMVKNAYTIITASEKAAINRAVAEMANLPDMGRWVERVAAPKANVEFPLSRIRDQLDRAGANTTALPDDLLLNFFRPTGSAPFGENIIRVVRNGENQFYRLNRDLHDTFQALDLEDSGKIIRILSQPAQLLRAGVVLEPSFTVANALRDTFSSAVIGKYGAVPFETTLRGVAALIGNPKLVSEWAASGGRSAVEASYFDRPKLQRFLAERISKDLTPAERALVVAKSPLTALRWLTGLSEEATRIGEYQKAYNSLTKSGMPEGEARRMAAFEARDRQDFAKGGAKTKIVRHLAAFWNAALQANVKLAQSFKQRPVRTTLQGLAYITTAKLLEQAVNWNDPDYWDRQQWERDLFFMIPIGKDASGHTRFLRIPTPFEVGLIFGTLPGRFMQWAKTHRPDAVKGLPSLILKQSVPNPTPSAVQLPFELIPDKGWDFFRGRQIVPESVADLPPESQWTEQTSALAKSVGKQLGVSPLKVDHAISQTTGGLGKLVSGRQAPGQRFVTAPLAVSNQPVQDFYDTLGKLRQLDQQMKLSGQNQHPSHLQDFEEASRKLSTLRKKAREATDEKAKADFQNQLFETAKSQMERYRAGQSSGKPRRIKPVTRQK